MTIRKNVRSITEKPAMYFDDYHVYLVKNQIEVSENVGSDNGFLGFEVEETEYEKDEFLLALSTGQVSLDTKASSLENMVLEMSEVVYA